MLHRPNITSKLHSPRRNASGGRVGRRPLSTEQSGGSDRRHVRMRSVLSRCLFRGVPVGLSKMEVRTLRPNRRQREQFRSLRADGRLGICVVGGLTAELFRRVAEHGKDVPGQMVLDLAMSRHRLGHPGPGVPVPVVAPAVPDQDASEVFDRPDQVNPLHGTSSSSTLRMPASSPLVSSR